MTLYSVKTGSVALTANATKSLWLLNPASDFLLVAEVSVSMDASATAAGVGFELYRVTTIGTPAGSSYTPVKVNRQGDAAAATTTALTSLSAEPTAVEIICEWFIQPFGGLLVLQYPLGREPLAAAAGNRIGLRYITPAGVTPNCRSYVYI